MVIEEMEVLHQPNPPAIRSAVGIWKTLDTAGILPEGACKALWL